MAEEKKRKKGGGDNVPFICTAGLPSKLSDSVAEILKQFPACELAEKWVKDQRTKPAERVAAVPVIPETFQVRDALSPDLNKSRFLEFKDRFYENLYCKLVPLGKATPANSKPDDITNESRSFGRPNPETESLYDVALPKKSPEQVMKEYIRWHDKYKLSHNDYYPAERKTRQYNDSFDPKRMYGHVINADPTGSNMKGAIQNFSRNRSFIIAKTHEDFLRQNKSMLGKPLKKIDMHFPQDKIFGRITPTHEFDVKGLLNSTVPPEEISEYANDTTYRAFSNDLYHSKLDCRKPAGIIESKYPRRTGVRFSAENLGEETRAKYLISPSIPTHFGLSHRDFMVPRPKAEIRRIFTKAGYDLKDDEHFEKVWELALKQWTSLGEEASVEAFKYALVNIGNEKK